MSVEQKLRSIIVDHFASFFRQASFRQYRGNVFVRSEGDACWTVELELSKDRSAEYGHVVPSVGWDFDPWPDSLSRVHFSLLRTLQGHA
jgi:hypothetical protein